MAEMIPPRSLFTRVLATLLPMCFLWVFVACASLCSMHNEMEQETQVAAISDSVNASGDSECCPLGQSPVVIVSERQSYLLQSSGDPQPSSLPAVLTIGETPSSRLRREVLPTNSDPPLKRLCTLRI